MHTTTLNCTSQFFFCLFVSFQNRTARRKSAIYLSCHFRCLPFPLTCIIVQCPGRKVKSSVEKTTIRNMIILYFVPFHISFLLLSVLSLSCLLNWVHFFEQQVKHSVVIGPHIGRSSYRLQRSHLLFHPVSQMHPFFSVLRSLEPPQEYT